MKCHALHGRTAEYIIHSNHFFYRSAALEGGQGETEEEPNDAAATETGFTILVLLRLLPLRFLEIEIILHF